MEHKLSVILVVALVVLFASTSIDAAASTGRHLQQVYPDFFQQNSLNFNGTISRQIRPCEWQYYTLSYPSGFAVSPSTFSVSVILQAQTSIGGSLNAALGMNALPVTTVGGTSVSQSNVNSTVGVLTCSSAMVVAANGQLYVAVNYVSTSASAPVVTFTLTVQAVPVNIISLSSGARSAMLVNQSISAPPTSFPGANIVEYQVTTPSNLQLGETMFITINTYSVSQLQAPNLFPTLPTAGGVSTVLPTLGGNELSICSGQISGADYFGCANVPFSVVMQNSSQTVLQVSRCVIQAGMTYYIGIQRGYTAVSGGVARTAIQNFTIAMSIEQTIRPVQTLGVSALQSDLVTSSVFSGATISHFVISAAQFLSVQVYDVVGGTVQVWIAQGGLAGPNGCAMNIQSCNVSQTGSASAGLQSQFPSCTFHLGFAQVTSLVNFSTCNVNMSANYYVAVAGYSWANTMEPITFKIVGVSSSTAPVALTAGNKLIQTIAENQYNFYSFTVPSTILPTQVLNFNLYADNFNGGNQLRIYVRAAATTDGNVAGPMPCLTNDFNVTRTKYWWWQVPSCLLTPGATWYVTVQNFGVTGRPQSNYYDNGISYTFMATLPDAQLMANDTTVSSTIFPTEYQHYKIMVPSGYTDAIVNGSAWIDVELVNQDPNGQGMTSPQTIPYGTLMYFVNFNSLAGNTSSSQCCYQNLYFGGPRQYFQLSAGPWVMPRCLQLQTGYYYVSVYLPGLESGMSNSEVQLATGYTITLTIRSTPYEMTSLLNGMIYYNESVADNRLHYYVANGDSTSDIEKNTLSIGLWNRFWQYNSTVPTMDVSGLMVLINRWTPATPWCYDYAFSLSDNSWFHNITNCGITCSNFFITVTGVTSDYYVPINYNLQVNLTGPPVTILTLGNRYYENSSVAMSYYKVQVSALPENGTFLQVEVGDVRYGNVSVYVTSGGLAGPQYESCRPTVGYCATDDRDVSMMSDNCNAVVGACQLFTGWWYVSVVKTMFPSTTLSFQQVNYWISATLVPGSSTLQGALTSGVSIVDSIAMNAMKFYPLPSASTSGAGFSFVTVDVYMDTMSGLEQEGLSTYIVTPPFSALPASSLPQSGSFAPLVCGSIFTNDTASTNVQGVMPTWPLNSSAVLLGHYSTQQTIQLCGSNAAQQYYVGIVGRAPRNSLNQTLYYYGVSARYTLRATVSTPTPINLVNGFGTVSPVIRPQMWAHYAVDLTGLTAGQYLRLRVSNIQNGPVTMFVTRSTDVQTCYNPQCQAIRSTVCNSGATCSMYFAPCDLTATTYYVSLLSGGMNSNNNLTGVTLLVMLNGSVSTLQNGSPMMDSIDIDQYKNYELSVGGGVSGGSLAVITVSNVTRGTVSVQATVMTPTGPGCTLISSCSTQNNTVNNVCTLTVAPCFLSVSGNVFVSVFGSGQTDYTRPIMYQIQMSVVSTVPLSVNQTITGTIPRYAGTVYYSIAQSSANVSPLNMRLLNTLFSGPVSTGVSTALTSGLTATVSSVFGGCFPGASVSCSTTTANMSACVTTAGGGSNGLPLTYPPIPGSVSGLLGSSICVSTGETLYVAITASGADTVRGVVSFQLNLAGGSSNLVPFTQTLGSVAGQANVQTATVGGTMSVFDPPMVFVVDAMASGNSLRYSVSPSGTFVVTPYYSDPFQSTGFCGTSLFGSVTSGVSTNTQGVISPCDSGSGDYAFVVNYVPSAGVTAASASFTLFIEMRVVNSLTSLSATGGFSQSGGVWNQLYDEYMFSPPMTTVLTDGSGDSIPNVFAVALAGTTIGGNGASAYVRTGGVYPASSASCCQTGAIVSATQPSYLNVCNMNGTSGVYVGVTSPATTNTTYTLTSSLVNAVSVASGVSTSVPSNGYGYAKVSLNVNGAAVTAISVTGASSSSVRVQWSGLSYSDAFCSSVTVSGVNCGFRGSLPLSSTSIVIPLYASSLSGAPQFVYVVFVNSGSSAVNVQYTVSSGVPSGQISLTNAVTSSATSAQTLVYAGVANTTTVSLPASLPLGSTASWSVQNSGPGSVCGQVLPGSVSSVCGVGCTGSSISASSTSALSPFMQVCGTTYSSAFTLAVQNTASGSVTGVATQSSVVNYTPNVTVQVPQTGTLQLQGPSQYYTRTLVNATVSNGVVNSYYFAITGLTEFGQNGANLFVRIENAAGPVTAVLWYGGQCNVAGSTAGSNLGYCSIPSGGGRTSCFASMTYCQVQSAIFSGQPIGVWVTSTSTTSVSFSASVFIVNPLTLNAVDHQIGFVFDGTLQTYIIPSFALTSTNSLTVSATSTAGCGGVTLNSAAVGTCFQPVSTIAGGAGNAVALSHCQTRSGSYYFTVAGSLNSGSQNFDSPITYSIQSATVAPRQVNIAPYEWVRWFPGTVFRILEDPTVFSFYLSFDVVTGNANCNSSQLVVSPWTTNNFLTTPANVSNFCGGSQAYLSDCNLGTPAAPNMTKCLAPCAVTPNTWYVSFSGGSCASMVTEGVLLRVRRLAPYTVPISPAVQPFYSYNVSVNPGTWNQYVITVDPSGMADNTDVNITMSAPFWNLLKVYMRTDKGSSVQVGGNGILGSTGTVSLTNAGASTVSGVDSGCSIEVTTIVNTTFLYVPNCYLRQNVRTALYLMVYGVNTVVYPVGLNGTAPYWLNVSFVNYQFTTLTSGVSLCDSVGYRKYYKLPVPAFTTTSYLQVTVDNVFAVNSTIASSRSLMVSQGSLMLVTGTIMSCNNGTMTIANSGSGTLYSTCYDVKLGALVIGVESIGVFTTATTFSYRITATLGQVTPTPVNTLTLTSSSVFGSNRQYFVLPVSSLLASATVTGPGVWTAYIQFNVLSGGSALFVSASVGSISPGQGGLCTPTGLLSASNVISGFGSLVLTSNMLSCGFGNGDGNVYIQVQLNNPAASGTYFTLYPTAALSQAITLVPNSTVANSNLMMRGTSSLVFQVPLPSTTGQILYFQVTGTLASTSSVSFSEMTSLTTPYTCGVSSLGGSVSGSGLFSYAPCQNSGNGGNGFVQVTLTSPSGSPLSASCLYNVWAYYVPLTVVPLTNAVPTNMTVSSTGVTYYQLTASNVVDGPVVVFLYGITSLGAGSISVVASNTRVPIASNSGCSSSLLVQPVTFGSLNSTERAFLVYGCGSASSSMWWLAVNAPASVQYNIMYMNPTTIASTVVVPPVNLMDSFFLNVYQLQPGTSGSVSVGLTTTMTTQMVTRYDSLVPVSLQLGRSNPTTCGVWDAAYTQQCEPLSSGSACFANLPDVVSTANVKNSLLFVYGRGAFSYNLQVSFGASNCGLYSANQLNTALPNNFCSALVPQYNTWQVNNLTASLSMSNWYPKYLLRSPQCPSAVCMQALQRLSCFVTFRNCDSQGYVHGVCRSVCWQAQAICGSSVSLGCTRTLYWEDDSTTCTGSLMAIAPQVQSTCPAGTNGQVCSGNGKCDGNGRCLCNCGWLDYACNRSQCPAGVNPVSGTTQVCSGQGVCDYSQAQSKCICNDNYMGSDCSIPRPQCPSPVGGLPCNGQGTCTYIPNPANPSLFFAQCSCTAPYFGTTCTLNSCPKVTGTGFICNNHGNCSVQAGLPVCSCDKVGGWFGSSCQFSNCTLPMDPQPCSGRGVCVTGINTGRFQCSCTNGYTGQYCTQPVCPLVNGVMCNQNVAIGATCNAVTQQCNCGRSGYSGVDCTVPLCPVTSNGICNGQGSCVQQSSTGTSSCQCVAPYSGLSCSTLQCSASSVGSLLGIGGQVCSGASRGYATIDSSNGLCSCVCQFGWGGPTCAQALFAGCTTSSMSICNGQGQCNVQLGSGGQVVSTMCACNDTWYGSKCEVSKCTGLTGAECGGAGVCSAILDASPPEVMPTSGRWSNYACECNRPLFGPNGNGGCTANPVNTFQPTPSAAPIQPAEVDLVVRAIPNAGAQFALPNASAPLAIVSQLGNQQTYLVPVQRVPGKCGVSTFTLTVNQTVEANQVDEMSSTAVTVTVNVICDVTSQSVNHFEAQAVSANNPAAYAPTCVLPAGQTAVNCPIVTTMSQTAVDAVCATTNCCYKGRICDNRGYCLNDQVLNYCQCTDKDRKGLNCASSKSNAGAIAGGTIGGIVGVALLGVLVWYFVAKKGGRSSSYSTSSSPTPETPSTTAADTMKANPLYGI